MNATSKHAKEIFVAAIRWKTPQEQDAFLQEACAGNDALRCRVNELLSAHAVDDNFLKPPNNVDYPPREPLAPADGILGDFRILREVGRGGMAVVYEAEQISLHRRVALKVLPFAAVLDKRQLQRFKTEAMAAARLHHQHIVPVHQVGCERAVHFYAMQYIEGKNVAELLRAIRQASGQHTQQDADPDASKLPATPTRETPAAVDSAALANLSTEYASDKPSYHRSMATLAIQAAQALDFAHENGILHRDIKPSNLMLDNEGQLWVTDFGLARIEGDPGLTMSGDLLGTLRYMSPEQVLGNRVIINERTDVYSLGITLYEMLTLTPAYEGTDKADLLRRISFEEPVPLRRMDPSIPVDLETIVLKATAKDPADRYGTAKELADDLQRYLNNQPILARRATLVAHVVKWAHRNRVLALSFSAAFIGGVVAASIVVVVKDREGIAVSRRTYPDAHAVTVENSGDSRPPLKVKPATPTVEPFDGLLPHPPGLPGIGRWQIASTRPTYSSPEPTIDWHPQGPFIAVCSDCDLRVYEVPRFELVSVFCGHTSDLTKASWSPDGTQIASASDDGTVRIWDFETGTPGAVLIGSTSTVRAVGWHSDGERLASGDDDGVLRIWTRDGNALALWRGHSGEIRDVDWSPDGKLLASAGEGTIRLWNDQGQKQSVIEPNQGWIQTVAWSPDGTQLLTAMSGSDEVCIWQLDGAPGPVFTGHTNRLKCAAWSPDGSQIASVAEDAKLCIWDADNSAKTTVEVKQGSMGWVAWRPDGSSLATLSSGAVELWDASGRAIANLPRCLGTRAARLSPDGQKLAANIGTGEEYHMLLCNSDGSQPQFLDDLAGYPLDFDWTPDSQSILVGGGLPIVGGGHAILRLCGRDGSAGPVLDEDPEDRRCVRRLSVSPNGTQAVVHFNILNEDKDWDDGGAHSSTLQIWNLDGTPGPICLCTTSIRHRPAWSPQGDRIAAIGGDRKLRIWSSEGELQATLLTAVWSEAVTWKPDGTEIAYLGETVQVWNVAGRQVAALRGPDIGKPPWEWAIPQSDRFSPNYSRGPAATIRFRDPQTGQVLWILAATSNEQVVKFSPDGRVIDGNPEVVDREFVYIIEKPTRAIEIVKPSEFHRRYFRQSR